MSRVLGRTILQNQKMAGAFDMIKKKDKKLPGGITKLSELVIDPFFVDEVIVLKEAINDIVLDPETKRRIYNRASELMERRKTENKRIK